MQKILIYGGNQKIGKTLIKYSGKKTSKFLRVKPSLLKYTQELFL
jgi:hypothetical protein